MARRCIKVADRRKVIERAGGLCEYCQSPMVFATQSFVIDHILPVIRGGESILENMALACAGCNRYKGPNIGSIDPQTGDLVPFFNPRKQIWREHFEIIKGNIQPLTAEARVTAKILKLNENERVEERLLLIEAGLFK